MSQRPEQEALQNTTALHAPEARARGPAGWFAFVLCVRPRSHAPALAPQQHEALWCDHGVPEGGRILYGLYMDEASTAASTEANTRVRRCMACASSQRAREDELGKVDAQGPSITSVTALDM